MGSYVLLICRSQTEAIGLRRQLARLGVPGELARPPRHERTESCGWAVRVSAGQADYAAHRLWQLGIQPCRVLREDGV